ncbi:MAG: hypothetical protein HC841_00165 [Verrucomicrobiae bacterium]|nr:hypothetical protein [Verrucomicrobiae bacterium]
MSSLKEIARDTLHVQLACNPVAVANGFARAMKSLREQGMGDHEILSSPITTLWISKLSSLNGWRSEWPTSLSRAFEFVESIAEQKVEVSND